MIIDQTIMAENESTVGKLPYLFILKYRLVHKLGK
jgi:hypothetical protein